MLSVTLSNSIKTNASYDLDTLTVDTIIFIKFSRHRSTLQEKLAVAFTIPSHTLFFMMVLYHATINGHDFMFNHITHLIQNLSLFRRMILTCLIRLL